MPSREDWAWLAGLIEGEGSFLTVTTAGYPYGWVQVGTTDEDIALRIQSLVGGTIHIDKRKEGWKTLYRWRMMRCKEAMAIAYGVFPWLGERRKQQVRKMLAHVGVKGAQVVH